MSSLIVLIHFILFPKQNILVIFLCLCEACFKIFPNENCFFNRFLRLFLIQYLFYSPYGQIIYQKVGEKISWALKDWRKHLVWKRRKKQPNH